MRHGMKWLERDVFKLNFLVGWWIFLVMSMVEDGLKMKKGCTLELLRTYAIVLVFFRFLDLNCK